MGASLLDRNQSPSGTESRIAGRFRPRRALLARHGGTLVLLEIGLRAGEVHEPSRRNADVAS